MGKKLKMVIVHHGEDEHTKYHEPHARFDEEHKEYGLPYEQAANALMSAKGYLNYVEKHGYHFTEELADHVSKMMENANGQAHTWTAQQVKKAMESLGLMPFGKKDGHRLLNPYYVLYIGLFNPRRLILFCFVSFCF